MAHRIMHGISPYKVKLTYMKKIINHKEVEEVTEISEKNLCKRSKGIYGINTFAYPRTLSRYRGSKA